MSGSLVLYRTEDGREQVQLRAVDGTVWLTQAEIAALFDTTVQNANLHLRNVVAEGELDASAVIKESLITAADGKRYTTRLYNLDAILAVGYRVRSPRGTQFRRWATTVLREYLVKGFALNDAKLKDAEAADYFDELLARIRDIRASEKRFYQKVRDLFAATSVDYDGKAKTARTFFATVQNKLVFAVTGQTAAELIVARADPAQPNMALTTWAGSRVRKTDVMVSKNYLNDNEMDLLNRLATGFLDFAELRARNRQQTSMADWVGQTDRFLAFNEQSLLQGAGRMSRERMEAIVAERFGKFDERRRTEEGKLADAEDAAEIDSLVAAAAKGRPA